MSATRLLQDSDRDALGAVAIKLAGHALGLASNAPSRGARVEPSAVARVARVVRMIESEPHLPHELHDLAHVARLSPYHFQRTFAAVTGVTPHQYVMRVRLRGAALQLLSGDDRVMTCPTSTARFAPRFGVSPRSYRRVDQDRSKNGGGSIPSARR